MIAVDTNILIRYLTGDEERQVEIAGSLFKKHNRAGEIYLSNIVLVEVEWVLISVYKKSRGEVCDVLEEILATRQFYFDDRELLRKAIQKYRNLNKDFSDSLIGELGYSKRIKTYTFDKDLKQDPNFICL